MADLFTVTIVQHMDVHDEDDEPQFALGVFSSEEDAVTAAANWIYLQGTAPWLADESDDAFEAFFEAATAADIVAAHFGFWNEDELVIEQVEVPTRVTPDWLPESGRV